MSIALPNRNQLDALAGNSAGLFGGTQGQAGGVAKIGLAQEVEFGPYLLQPLKSQGINRIDDSALVLRVKFMTKPNDQFLVRREVYRRLQEAFHHNGIEFASRRVVVEAAELNADEEAAAAANVAVLTPAGAAARNLG